MKKKSFIEKYKELKKNDMLREEELFQNNKADIQKSNLKVLKGLMLVVVPLMIGLVFISLFFEPLNELRNIYIILLGTCMLIIVLSNICKNAKVSLAGLYIFLFAITGFALHNSIFRYPDEVALSLLGVLCLAPLVILDRSWRIGTVAIGIYLIHEILAFHYKPTVIAQEDMVNLACFMLTALFVGSRVRMTNLQNFEMKRQAHI